MNSRTWIEITMNDRPEALGRIVGHFQHAELPIEGLHYPSTAERDRKKILLRVAGGERLERLLDQLCTWSEVLGVRRGTVHFFPTKGNIFENNFYLLTTD